MKRHSILIVILFVVNLFPAQAQEDAVAGAAPEDQARYAGLIEIGYLYGKTNNANSFAYAYMATPTVQMFNGYRFARFFALGATLGFDFYDNVLITPIALGIRGEFLKTRISPFYSLDVGYGSAKLSDESDQFNSKGGWLFNPALGMRIQTGNKTAFTFGLGYKTQRVKNTTTWWGGHVAQKITYKRLSLRMGFLF